MSESQADGTAKPKSSPLRWALWGVALVGVAAVLYIIAQASIKPGQAGGLKSMAKGEMAKFVIPAEAGAAPATSFVDAEGKTVRLADFRGKTVVLNLWATWCAPCIIEMPTLAKLAAAYEGKPVEVIALSMDGPRDRDKAQAFIARHAPLKFYQDPNLAYPYALEPKALGMPTTIVFGPDGVERGRVSGEADWSSDEARALIDKVAAGG